MGFFDKLKDTIKETELLNELCDHLKSIGIAASVLDSQSPDRVQHSATLGIFGNPPLGSVKVEGRDIDAVEIYRMPVGGAPSGRGRTSGGLSVGIGGFSVGIGKGGGGASPSSLLYIYEYVVKRDVGEQENQFKAELSHIEKGLLKKEIVGFEWKGGKLAQDLAADTELGKMLISIGLPGVRIRPDKKDKYVAISTSRPSDISISITGVPVKHEWTIGRKDFPSKEAFDVYDRVAQHIKNLTIP